MTKIISYYTLKTPYEEEIKNLISSCDLYSLPYEIEGVNSLGSWEKNCAIKPFFIYEKLKKLKEPIFWVDADAAFLQNPDFTQFEDCDLSVRYMEIFADNQKLKIAAGSIFINYTSSALFMTQKWCDKVASSLYKDEESLFLDQWMLAESLESIPELKVKKMPVSYCKVFDNDAFLIKDEEVVIEHYQASRRFKNFYQNF